MRGDILEIANELRLITDTQLFWDRIGTELKKYGITSFLYSAAASRYEVEERGLMASLIIKNNYSQKYFDEFGEDTFLIDDLTAVRALHDATPIIWHDTSNWDDATPMQLAHAHAETEIGFGVGVTIPTVAIAPGHIGGIGLCAGDLTTSEFNSMWEAQSNRIMHILSYLDFGMRQTHLPKIIGLSKREKEVLSWLAGGLRPDQIADRLGIGYRTVDKYINSAKSKLHATTRDNAVAKALIFNVIQP